MITPEAEDMLQTVRRVFRILEGYGIFFFHMAVLFYILMLLFTGASIIFAQATSDERAAALILKDHVDGVSQRVQIIENLYIDRRLALLEKVVADQEKNSAYTGMGLGGVGLLLAERLAQVIRQAMQKKESNESPPLFRP